MKNGEIVTLDKVTGEIIEIRFWDERDADTYYGKVFVRLKHKGSKNSDHIVTPDVESLRRK